jgi:hypothetical protein
MKKRIRGWPVADSIIYATARSRSAQVVTGDPHFKGLDDVVFLGPSTWSVRIRVDLSREGPDLWGTQRAHGIGRCQRPRRSGGEEPSGQVDGHSKMTTGPAGLRAPAGL